MIAVLFSFQSMKYTDNLNGRLQNCGSCKKAFPELWKKSEHSKKENLNLKVENSLVNDSILQSELCKKRFSGKSRSRKRNTNFTEYSCTKCRPSKYFKHRSLYLRHLLVHTKERAAKCTICPKTFKRSDYLKVHLNFHRKKPYLCQNCFKTFETADLLKYHVCILKKEGSLTGFHSVADHIM